MSNENELLEPLATEAGQQAIVRAIRDISSLEYAVRAEQAASQASIHAGQATQSALQASEAENKAKDWATKTDGYVEQETITIPPAQEGEEPTTETINLYSAKYYAAQAQDIFNNMSFDSVPTENSTNMVSSGTVYSALDLKADKSTTYTKTEVDTALSNVQGQLTFDNVPTANSDNPVKSSGIKTALDSKQDTLTFDSMPTANSTNPVTSGGVYTALQNVDANIEVDDEITEDSDNPVTSAAIYEALQNFTPSGGGDTYNGDVFVSGTYIDTNNLIQNIYNQESSWDQTAGIKVEYTATQDCFVCGYLANGTSNTVNKENYGINVYINDVFIQNVTHTTNSHSVAAPINLPLKRGDVFKVRMLDASIKGCLNVFGVKHGDVVSEQMYSNVLYENSSGWSSGNITLNDSLENYNFIEFIHGETSSPTQRYSSIFSQNEFQNYINNNNRIVLQGNGSQYFMLTVSSNTQLNYVSRNANVVYKIIGHKMAKGGYSGIVSDARMTIKGGTYIIDSTIPSGGLAGLSIVFDSPMPDTNYYISMSGLIGASNASRAKFFYGNKTVNGFDFGVYPTNNTSIATGMTVDWIAIRPNSYTREGMVEDVLFSNASGVNSGTINLSGNISDYDLIQFKWRADTHTGTNEKYGSNIVLCSLLQEHIGKKYELDAWNERFIGFYITSDNSFTVDTKSELSIFKITGIKFGRYVSGVAVDTTVTQNSNAVITSGAVYDALQNAGGGGGGSSITVDSTITQGGTNPVEGGAIYTALSGKQDTLTFDSTPTAGSSNPVTSDGINTALSGLGSGLTTLAGRINDVGSQLQYKQELLSYDSVPTENSPNMLASGAIYTALNNKADKSDTYTKTEVDTALASKGDVTTNTDQNITGTKTFVGSKKVGFKQSTANDKLGFTLFGNTGTERGYLEFNPTNTIDGVAGLMTLGNYATSAGALTHVGFRRYSNISGANGAYNLLTPLVADAKSPFSLTTSYTNFYLPLGFTDGTTTVRTAKSGLVDLSPLLASLEARIAALEGN